MSEFKVRNGRALCCIENLSGSGVLQKGTLDLEVANGIIRLILQRYCDNTGKVKAVECLEVPANRVFPIVNHSDAEWFIEGVLDGTKVTMLRP